MMLWKLADANERLVTCVQVGDCPSQDLTLSLNDSELRLSGKIWKRKGKWSGPTFLWFIFKFRILALVNVAKIAKKEITVRPSGGLSLIFVQEDMTPGLVVNQATPLEYKGAITPLDASHSFKNINSNVRMFVSIKQF